MFFLTNILWVHVRKLGTSVRKSTTKSDLQNLQNRGRLEQTRRSLVIHRRDIRERSHECTQVHDEKRSSKLAKSVPFGEDKTLICHSEKRYTRAKSRTLSPRLRLVHACDRHRSMDFWVLAVLAVFKAGPP